ncbi:MAG: hypothetical protein QG635_274 [Bacteroidota bacterium]|nr:hypothetical protein [Bacteroidota bacterium]
MALYVYKTRDFDETYENSLFDELHAEIGPLFESRRDNTYLIGNYNCQEKAIDAFILKSTAIIIIEFKNYGGKISFENDNIEAGTWKSNNMDIKCGHSYTNPYRQVVSYKTVLGDTFKHIHTVSSADPYQSHGIVLFNKNVDEIDAYTDFRFYRWSNNDVTYNTWFHIIDKNKFANKIGHISSRNVWYDDNNLNELVSKLKEHTIMYLAAEYKRSDTQIFDFIKTKTFQRENFIITETNKGVGVDDLIASIESDVKGASEKYFFDTKERLEEVYYSINGFTIADESEIKDFADKIFYKERTLFDNFVSEVGSIADTVIESKNLPEDRIQKIKNDFSNAFFKKFKIQIDESKSKTLRELTRSYDEKTRNLALEIGEKIFQIKMNFFKVLTNENELEVEFVQKNNLLQLEIELRTYLFLKYKEALAEIRRLLTTPLFSVVSFMPLFLQIPSDSENHLQPQEYLVFALMMKKNLENEPFKESVAYISNELKISEEVAGSSLQKIQKSKLIFNLDKNGCSRFYINAPKLIKLKEELFGIN